MATFSRTLEHTLRRALSFATEHRHEYVTLEHLLLSLIDDDEAGQRIASALNVAQKAGTFDHVECQCSDFASSISGVCHEAIESYDLPCLEVARCHEGNCERNDYECAASPHCS